MRLRRAVLRDRVTVKPYTGEGAYGPLYGEPVTVRCIVDETRKLVRNAEGDEVVAEATLTLHPHPHDETTRVELDAAKLFVPESQVTVHGRDAAVIRAQTTTVRGHPISVEVTVS